MIKAKRPDQTIIRFRRKLYKIWDAFPSKRIAEECAADTRTQTQDGIHRTRVVVVDLGKDAGRLRYALFAAKGVKM